MKTASRDLLRAVLLVCLTGLGSAAWAAGATIVAIYESGNPVQRTQLRVAAGMNRPQNVLVQVGTYFETGTVLETATQTVELRTTNGNTLRLGPNAEVRVAVSPAGERHTVAKGSFWANVVRKLDFFQIVDDKGTFQGAAEGTVYGIEIGGGNVRFQRTEGTVRLQRKVQVRFAGLNADAAQGRSRELDTYQYQELSDGFAEASFRLTAYENEFQEFASFAQADATFRQALQLAQQRQDWVLAADFSSTLGELHLEGGTPDLAAQFFTNALNLNFRLIPGGIDPVFVDDFTGLGYAYMDLQDPANAISNFQRAIAIQQQIDPYDPLIADSFIDMAEAFELGGRTADAWQYASQAIGLLEIHFAIHSESYQEAVQFGQRDAAAYFAEEMIADYESLGWAWSLRGETARADELFSAAEEMERRVFGNR